MTKHPDSTAQSERDRPVFSGRQMAAIYDAIVMELIEQYSDRYDGDPVCDGFQARLIVGGVRDRLL